MVRADQHYSCLDHTEGDRCCRQLWLAFQGVPSPASQYAVVHVPVEYGHLYLMLPHCFDPLKPKFTYIILTNLTSLTKIILN